MASALMAGPPTAGRGAERPALRLLVVLTVLALCAVPLLRAQAPAPPAAVPDSASPAQLESIEARLRAAIQLTPGVASFHATLGDVLMAQGRPEEARTALAEAVRLEPTTVEYRAALGQAHLAQQEWAEAETNFAYAITLSPQDAGLHAALAESLLQQGRLDEAEESFDRAASMAPGDTLLALRRDEIRSLRNETATSTSRPALLAAIISLLRYAAATFLTIAGAVIALPVLASLVLIVVIIPFSLLRRRRTG